MDAPGPTASAAAEDAAAPHAALPRAVRVVLALFAIVLCLGTQDAPGSWADGSRLGTIQALVEHGTLALDDTAYVWQGDKVRFGEHYFSHQPPMLALAGALPYAALHHGLGLAIDAPWTYRLLTLCLVGLPAWCGALALARLLARTALGPRQAAGWLAAACLATLYLPYALVLNQHGAAAGLVLMGIERCARRRFACAGILLALAATIDLGAAFPALFACWPVWRAGGAAGVARYALAALPVLALHASVNLAVAGDLVPFALHAEAFQYPLSPFTLMSLTGIEGGPEPDGAGLAYAARALFGSGGLFSNHPVLLVCLLDGALAARAVRVRPSGAPAPGLLAAVALSAITIAGYYLAASRNFGGSAFGMRWFTVFAPALVLFPAAAAGTGLPRWRTGRAFRALLLALGAWSALFAAVGALQPWAKLYWRFEDTPRGMVANPGEARPSAREFWRGELERRLDWRKAFSREHYDQQFQELLDQHRRLYLNGAAALPAAEREAWLREGLAKLHAVVDPLERENVSCDSRVWGHFWLGKFYKALDDVPAARRELERALELYPRFGKAEAALNAL
jgi:hypothetical protein